MSHTSLLTKQTVLLWWRKKIKPTLVSHDAISQVIDGDISSSSDFWLSHPFANQMPVEHSDHQTRHLHKWPSVMATHTILREHEPEDWEKDMRRGLPLEKCIYNISIPYCCRHFFSLLRRPDTVQPANCKFTWTYDLPFSDHMLLAHFVSIGKKI